MARPSIQSNLRSFRSIRCTRSYSLISNKSLAVQDYPAPHTGVIRVLSLNKFETRNAISRSLLKDLRSEVVKIEGQSRDSCTPVRAAIIASALDNCFCAGADLKERLGFTRAESAAFLDSLRSTLRLIEDLPVPSIAAVSSVALGGGLELAMATSLRVFARTAVVGLPETRLGIIPGAGGTYRLGRLIGKSHAKDLILTGRRVDADEAFRLGLCNRLVGTTNDTAEVARQQALTEALKLATQICDGGPLGVRAALKAIDAGNEEGENAQYETVIDTDDRNEALLAFKEKRKPAFIGR